MGPITYLQHLVSGPRLPFTAAYFGSIALTLYFAVGVSPSSCRHFAVHQSSPALLPRRLFVGTEGCTC